ncbi:MAG: DUF697 domain-containing protein, partial [Merismopedia sp. SIO2A8]|nr:DUF697 domain-containing protein [Merismopedia sp. SIO2A8]
QLDTWQTEVRHDDTQDVLQGFLDQVKLTSRERQAIDPSLRQLRDMARRLEQSIVQIAVFGLVGRGKSSVLNALVGEPIFATGPLHGVTTTVERSPWSLTQNPLQPMASASPSPPTPSPLVTRLSLPTTANAHVELIDTPGLDEVDGEQRTALAHQVAKQADLILFVVAGDITSLEHQALSELRQWSKPILLVFNKIDQYPDTDRQKIYATIRDQRVKQLLSPEEIVMTAAAPLVSTVNTGSDGRTVVKRQRGTPQVMELKLKILDILQREGKSLVALNTMLYADEVNETIVQRKTEIRDRAANDLIWAIVMVKAIAMALNPITVLDVLSGAAIDIVMIVLLSRLYGIPMTQHGALKLLRTIAVGMGGVSVSELLTTLGLSSLKSALGLAAPVTGGLSLAPYVSVAIAQAGVAGVSTYIIGQISKTYLANGASWGEQSPKATIKAILNSLDETSLLYRVKHELEARLQSR